MNVLLKCCWIQTLGYFDYPSSDAAFWGKRKEGKLESTSDDRFVME